LYRFKLAAVLLGSCSALWDVSQWFVVEGRAEAVQHLAMMCWSAGAHTGMLCTHCIQAGSPRIQMLAHVLMLLHVTPYWLAM
jgi:hypothetical protein